MARIWLMSGAILGGTAVCLGAFGAHALSDILDDYSRGIYEKAVFYHFIHALALLAVGILQQQFSHQLTISGISFLLGILLFSGSLYLLAITGMRWLGAVTPIGGLLFIIGWIWIAYQSMQIT
jgi:uncharacterized membrane protein YgdD (TMEM256/DUF423 family)